MQDKAGRSMINAAMAAPYLGKEEEFDLARRWKHDHDQDALHRITVAHMRLVISVAARFRHFGLSMGDLIQEGHVGLLEAAARFEPERDVRFSTYATWWIRASMQDYILAQLVDRARRHQFGAEGAVLQPAAAARQAREGRRHAGRTGTLPEDLVGTGRIGSRCRLDGFTPFPP